MPRFFTFTLVPLALATLARAFIGGGGGFGAPGGIGGPFNHQPPAAPPALVPAPAPPNTDPSPQKCVAYPPGTPPDPQNGPPCQHPTPPPPAAPLPWSPKAIYFMTNDAQANSIAALPVLSRGGQLDYGSFTPTGGAGGAEINPTTRAPIAPGSLASQGSVRVAAGMVFAVNAGSNTLSMLAIDAADPTKLTMVGAPVDTLGDFPVTLAVSAADHLVCVGNTGAKAGIACSRFTSAGLGPMDTLRPFSLNQTSPPTGPFNTVSETFFNEAGTVLHTTVKGGSHAGEPGFLSAFSVLNGNVSTVESRSVPDGLFHLCGAASIPGTDKLLVADLLRGARLLRVDSSDQVSEFPMPEGTYYNETSCWVSVLNSTGTAFLTDASVNHLVQIDPANGTVVDVQPTPNDYPGMTDVLAVGFAIFALAPGNATRPPGVVVFDATSGRNLIPFTQLTRPANLTAAISGLAAFWPPDV